MLIHWIWLATRPHLTDRAKAMLLQHFRDPEDIFFADRESFAHIDGMTREGAEALSDKDLHQAEKILTDCAREKVHVLTFRDANYPSRLRHIADPPLVLYYKGNLPDFDGSPLISVVGTRKASGYGLQMARQLGYQIAKCGAVVVSGIAEGIDAAAMQGALTAGSPVVGILGNGADVVYPPCNRGLYLDTERYGCLIGEYPPGTEPFRWNFPRRNRIISGISCGVLVVEAPKKSGSLITANQALEQGRDVFVLPGNVDNPGFEGSLNLLREGGIPVRNGWDVMSEYAALYPDKIRRDTTELPYPEKSGKAAREAEKPSGKVAQATALPMGKGRKNEKSNKKVVDNAEQQTYSDVNKDLPKLTDEQRAIVAALQGGERLVDDVIAQLELPAHKVSSALTMLAIKGIVKKLPGNRIALK